ncbi:MAG: hypothetical protein UY92_C0006G0066 [Candidatus Magasanikbacteria bacterium GW2011_GWA2_56_11]|uniref:DOT1 domain-containing protein n=1 Tax=Candidatus Magasanikbacteria bacterium GW2011_GWA2_56_11 TaxID=1619044 RepID=A0A0G1YH07_9BACT|nr:MAG: hypothetical protein UY92_C0006G0066 [Candidatus Magasanikbacteria bacterium GW2011_GWA2_56_11]
MPDFFLPGVLTLVVLGLLAFFGYMVYAAVSGAPFWPLAPDAVGKLIASAGLDPRDTLVDLGSGDGRILEAAAPYVRSAVGFEINPFLCWWSRFRLRHYPHVRVLRRSFWGENLSGATVVTLFFIPGKMDKLAHKLLAELAPGTRIVSAGFQFPGWHYEKKDGTVYLYLVPPAPEAAPPN